MLCVRRKLQRLVWEDSELSHTGLEYASQLSWFTVEREREEKVSILPTICLRLATIIYKYYHKSRKFVIN